MRDFAAFVMYAADMANGVISRQRHRARTELSLESLSNASFPPRASGREALLRRYELVAALLRENREYLVSQDYYLNRFAGYGSPPHTQWQGARACYESAARLYRSLFSRTDRPIFEEGRRRIPESGTDVFLWGVFPTIYLIAGGVMLLAVPAVELYNLAASERRKVRLMFNRLAGEIALQRGDRIDREDKFDQVSARLSERISRLGKVIENSEVSSI